MKQVMIDQQLFNDLLVFFADDCTDPALQESICARLVDKIYKILAHRYYSESKSASTDEERAAFRRKYLESLR